MSRPQILLDVDGPLTPDFFFRCCAELRNLGLDAWPGLIDQWDIVESFKGSRTQREEMYTRLRRPGVATSFGANQGALKFLTDLRVWADVIAVTAPLEGSATWMFERETWLVDRLAFRPKEIFHARDKSKVSGDAFVDDCHEHLTQWTKANPAGLAIMWHEPHNAKEPWVGVKARDYDELYEQLRPLRGLVEARR